MELPCQKARIGTGNIDIAVKIHPERSHGPFPPGDALYLIQHDIQPPRRFLDIFGNVLIEGLRIRQGGKTLGLKVEKNDPFRFYTPFQQFLPEQGEDGAFPAPAHTGNYLYHRFVDVIPDYF
jgi:hypothetical protein